MSVNGFDYEAWHLIRAGITWYRQGSGKYVPDPIWGEWELYYTDGPSWWLFGPDYSEINMCTRRVKEAMIEAAPYVKGERSPYED